jgi:RNA polymerase sigma factor (sigma-70 family)
MEVSALRYSGGIGLHGRSALLRLQSDERLIALIRRGNSGAFEVLVSRYHSRLLAFCRHLLGSKEDAEDVLQEVLAAAFNAILADERAINVRPWLYRIARNRSLNHLRRIQAIGVDSMDIHFSENGASTADKVHDREQFRLLVGDIQGLPETQRTALVLREMDALSYDQIAEAMDTTVPGVKSLLVRARISLAEAAEARQLSCEEVRIELAEVAEGLTKRPTPLVRRHLRTCRRCASFQSSLKHTNRALAALLPIGPLALVRQLLIAHIGHSAGTGSGATAAGAAGATGATGASAGAGAGGVAAGQAAAVGSGAAFGSAGGLISAGAGAVATKAAAGLAAAALVTAGAVEATHVTRRHHPAAAVTAALVPAVVDRSEASGGAAIFSRVVTRLPVVHGAASKHHHKVGKAVPAKLSTTAAAKATHGHLLDASTLKHTRTKKSSALAKKTAGRTQTQTDATVLSSPAAPSGSSSPPNPTGAPDASSSPPSSTGSSSSTSSWNPNTGSGSASSPSATTPGASPAGSTPAGSTSAGSPGSTTTTPTTTSITPAGPTADPTPTPSPTGTGTPTVTGPAAGSPSPGTQPGA